MENDDVGVPLYVVVNMAISSLPIPPLDAFRRLGFYILNKFRRVKVVDQEKAATLGTTAGTSARAPTIGRLAL